MVIKIRALNMRQNNMSLLFTIAAMVLLVISRLMDGNTLDWIAYAAIVIIIASIYHMIKTNKRAQ